MGCRFCRSQAPHREKMSPISEGRPLRRARCQAWWLRSHLSWRTPKSPLARDSETCRTHPGAEPSGARTLSSGSHLGTCVSLTCSLSRPWRQPRSSPSSQSGRGDRAALPRSPTRATGGVWESGSRDRGWESLGLRVRCPDGGLFPRARSD